MNFSRQDGHGGAEKIFKLIFAQLKFFCTFAVPQNNITNFEAFF